MSSLGAAPINISDAIAPVLLAGTRPSGTVVASGTTGGLAGDSSKQVTEQLSQLTSQLSETRSIQETIVTSLTNNTEALTQNTAVKSAAGSVLNGATAASNLLGGGFGLSPLISGLFSLFSGGPKTQTTVLTQYIPPPSIQSEAGLMGTGSVLPVDYSQNQAPRAQASGAAPQVTVQVNAIDSKSFLDHSDAIADAVKQAILNSNALNDVLTNL